MKSFLLAVAFIFLTVNAGIAQYSCATQEYQEYAIRINPSLQYRFQQAESFTRGILTKDNSIISHGVAPTGLPVITIPVVVHVLYRNADENISDEQIHSQIDILNKEFRKIHADTAKIPVYFRSIAADCRIEFVLAAINPKGYATNGIIRKKTSAYSFGLDDKIKFSGSGGDDAWDSDKYLNIWVGNLTSGIHGYSSILGGPKDRDGIAVRNTAFGNTGKITVPYTKGRTAVHEVGHWLGLRHIWGDQYCGSDGIDDTPTQGIATRGCPSGIISSCNNSSTGNMYNNYMDLTSDECTNMFTIGQRDKMRAAFAAGGPRYALLFSNGINGIPLPGPPPDELLPIPIVSVYPNPVHKAVTIDIRKNEVLLGEIITIHNQLGQLVFHTLITKYTISINIESLKEGIYFIRIGSQSKPFKLLKTNGVTTP